MGYWKNKQIEWNERGYDSIETVVCRGCVGDYALKNFIKNNGRRQKCDYCGKRRISADLEEVIGLIVNGANSEYKDANGCLLWDGAEGGYQGSPTYNKFEFVHDILNYEMYIENDKLLEDITNTLSDAMAWCEDPYNLRIHEEDYMDWEEFCEQVKAGKLSISQMASSSSYPILNIIGEYIEKFDLIVKSNRNCGYFRSRPHENFKFYYTAKDIGSAPSCNAAENRMSPKGMSMFYGAEDIDTTLLEINVDSKQSVTSAKFYPTKPLNVLDLTKLSLMIFPSLFDEDNRSKRSPLSFLRKFASNISRPIIENKEKEYLPTQVFTEYLKKYKTNDDKKIDGIIYTSSKNDKKCCALFFNNDECTDNKNEKAKKLWMDKDSIIRIN